MHRKTNSTQTFNKQGGGTLFLVFKANQIFSAVVNCSVFDGQRMPSAILFDDMLVRRFKFLAILIPASGGSIITDLTAEGHILTFVTGGLLKGDNKLGGGYCNGGKGSAFKSQG